VEDGSTYELDNSVENFRKNVASRIGFNAIDYGLQLIRFISKSVNCKLTKIGCSEGLLNDSLGVL